MIMSFQDNEPEFANWRKSARSVNNGACTEVASVAGIVMVRDSQDPDTLVVRYTARSWREFLNATRAGALDALG
jgi:hypothetical protein